MTPSHPLLSAGLLWLKSLRCRFVDSPALPASGILVLWHEHMLLCLPAFAHRNMRVLISQSRDGEWGVEAAQRLGYQVIRGSSSRGGAASLRSLARELRAHGGWVALVADGPRGPRRVAKPGAVWLSQDTGLPVVATSASVRHGIRLRSWDRCVIPPPFSQVRLRLSRPFHPAKSDQIDRALHFLPSPPPFQENPACFLL